MIHIYIYYTNYLYYIFIIVIHIFIFYIIYKNIYIIIVYPVVGRELRQLIPYGATKSFPTHHMALVVDMIETPVTCWLKIGIAIFFRLEP